MLHISPESAASQEAIQLLQEHDADLVERYGETRNHSKTQSAGDDGAHVIFLIAWFGGEAVGCGRLRTLDWNAAEITHIYIIDRLRGRGIGRELMRHLEEHAYAMGVRRLVVETGDRQPEANSLFAGAGFYRIPGFGSYQSGPHTLCFEKRLHRFEGANPDPSSTRQPVG